jgi:adenosylcobinamide kinase/adenosylcobinamide-phosphate guanylyltransferase
VNRPGPADASAVSRRVLVLGGARSGKSAFAESLLDGHDGVQYVATSKPDPEDAEWRERVTAHRLRRPAGWATIETGDLAAIYAGSDPAPALIDSLTGWLTRLLDENGAWQNRPGWRQRVEDGIDALVSAVRSSGRHSIAVSDEVGSGIVPESAAGRLFRDLLGTLNQRVAGEADEVWLVTAGIGSRLR